MNIKLTPPRAAKHPKELKLHGHTRIDNYFWLNERDTEPVLSYLKQENEYYEKASVHTLSLQQVLFDELKGRIEDQNESVPYFYNGYWYITRYEQGSEYPIYIRWKDALLVEEQVLFNGNEMAKGESFFELANFEISPCNTWAAFFTDTLGRRLYTLKFKNLQTGEVVTTAVTNAAADGAWSSCGKYFFYTVKDEETLRSASLFRHHLLANEADELIYTETDDTFVISVSKSKSQEYIFLDIESTLTTETRLLSAASPLAEFAVFAKRQRGLEYSVYHYADKFYVLNNRNQAENFQLDTCPITHTSIEYWQELIPHRSDTLLEGVDLFEDFFVLSEQHLGQNKIHIINYDHSIDYYLPFDSEAYTAYTHTNPSFSTPWLRYVYSSLTTPTSVIDFNMLTQERVVRKEQAVRGGFNKEKYTSERLWAVATDGTQIPISIVYHRTAFKKDGNSPVLLYGYGSYGINIDPSFSSNRLALLDRGFAFAIAHIRGGEDFGRNWYEKGKLLNKCNTFTDFIACGEYLIKEGYTSPQHLYAMGGSAGGLLMGAVMNLSDKLFNGVVAQVPFVDVVTTMLDEDIPLTTGEYDEWGNPNEEEYYRYMLSYSPYDNVTVKEYPHLLVTTGYYDSQVQYWEPAKWVAKLRELKTDDNFLFLYTDMTSGHSGASGRFKALKEVAREYAFLIDLEMQDK